MSKADKHFRAIHAHGLVRVAAATPIATVGDPAANAQATLALAQAAHDAHVDLVVYPELNLSSYAVDDLHLQDGFRDAIAAALATVIAGSAKLSPVLVIGVPLPRNGRLYNTAVVISRGKVLGVVPKSFLPNYREYYEKRWFAPGVGLAGLTIDVARRDRPVRHRPAVRRRRPARISSSLPRSARIIGRRPRPRPPPRSPGR